MSPLALSPLTERLRTALREPKIALALLLVVTAFAYRGNLTLGFTDTDAIADVAYADVNSLADLGSLGGLDRRGRPGPGQSGRPEVCGQPGQSG